MKELAAAAALVIGLAGCQWLPVAPQTTPIPVSPSVKFDLKCNQFYEIVLDLAAQRRRGNIGDETFRQANAPIQAGHALCQRDDIGSYGGALTDLEAILNEIEVD